MCRQSAPQINVYIVNSNVIIDGSNVEIGGTKTAEITTQASILKKKRLTWKALIELLNKIGTTAIWICQLIALFVSGM